MRLWPGYGDFHTLTEWQKADSFSTFLRATCDTIKLSRDREWLLEVLREAADRLPVSIAEGQNSEYLAEYILSLDSVRGSLAIIEYCMRFMRSMEMISEEVADSVESRRAELDDLVTSLTVSLRSRLGEQWGFSNN